MRFSYPNVTRPQKAAKTISKLTDLPLSSVQNALSQICGYQDWFDLQKNCAKDQKTELDQALSQQNFILRKTSLALSLAEKLNISTGDAQFALSRSRLTGDRQSLLADEMQIRLTCYAKTDFLPSPKRTPGACGVLKTFGRNREAVILKSFGRPTVTVSHRGITNVADFEYTSPKAPPDLFIPMRLYLPYGCWTEADGAKVLFSRDYFPMWRIRADVQPQRLEPWLWIRHTKQEWFWGDGGVPWQSELVHSRAAEILADYGVRDLPLLVEALPLIVYDPEVESFKEAAEALRALRLKHLSAHAA